MIIKLLMILIFTILVSKGQEDEVDFIFVAHDAGESYMFQPVIDNYINSSYSNSPSFIILCLGEPSTSIFTSYNQSRTLSDYNIDVTVLDGKDGRYQRLSEEDLNKLTMSIQTNKVITGMVYEMEAQIASLPFNNNNYDNNNNHKSDFNEMYVIGLDDSFALWDNTSIPSTLFVLPNIVKEVFVTADMIGDAIPPSTIATTTGSPTLDSWMNTASDTKSINEVREKIYGSNNESNNDDENDFIGVVFAGGYDHAFSEYDHVLHAYCQTALKLTNTNRSTSNNHNNNNSYSNSTSNRSGDNSNDGTVGDRKANEKSSKFRFSFSPHPGYSPLKFEIPRFKKWGCDHQVIRVIFEDEGVSTASIVAASNVSMSECSTVGGQSIAINTPHAFGARSSNSHSYSYSNIHSYSNGTRSRKTSKCEDVFTVAGLIPYTPSSKAMIEAITLTFAQEQYYVPTSAIVKEGIPVAATKRMMSRLQELFGF